MIIVVAILRTVGRLGSGRWVLEVAEWTLRRRPPLRDKLHARPLSAGRLDFLFSAGCNPTLLPSSSQPQ
jgi:hypothetical protein